MASTSLLKVLSAQLECPVCQQYMTGEIAICENGHNLCVKCRNSLAIQPPYNRKFCPTCRGILNQGRNYALEKLASEYMFACRHKGCLENFCANEIAKHEEICRYGGKPCVLINTGCQWSGTDDELKKHLLDNHTNFVHEMYSTRLLNTIPPCQLRQGIYFIDDEIFMIHMRSSEETIVISCMSCKYSENVRDYKLIVTFNNERDVLSSIPCIPRCDANNIFDGYNITFCKKMLDSYITKTTVGYDFSFTLENKNTKEIIVCPNRRKKKIISKRRIQEEPTQYIL